PHQTLAYPSEQLPEISWTGRLCSSRHCRTDGDGFVVTLEPHQERRFLRSRQTLLVQIRVVRAHVGVYQRAGWIELGIRPKPGQQLIHRTLPLSRGEAHKQGEWLGPPQGFAGRPLGEGGAENLRSGTLGQ